MAAKYEEAQSDPELLSLREELALVDARIADLMSRVDSGESGAAWAAIGKALAEYKTATDPGKRAEAWATVERVVGGGGADYAAWADVMGLVERRRKLVETEANHLARMGQMISAERTMTMLAVVVDVIRRHVTDRDTLSSISREIGQLVDLKPRD